MLTTRADGLPFLPGNAFKDPTVSSSNSIKVYEQLVLQAHVMSGVAFIFVFGLLPYQSRLINY